MEIRFRELERRMGLVESEARSVPVMARDLAEIKGDLIEVRDDQRSLRRALYTTALSITGSSVLFAVSVFQIFNP